MLIIFVLINGAQSSYQRDVINIVRGLAHQLYKFVCSLLNFAHLPNNSILFSLLFFFFVHLSRNLIVQL